MPFSPQGRYLLAKINNSQSYNETHGIHFAIREGVKRGFLHRFSVYNCTATKEVQPFKNNLKSRFLYI